MDTSTFITKASAIHDQKYNYAAVVYINAHTPVTITCTRHGAFAQLPDLHLRRKSGCPVCAYEQRASTRRARTPWLSFEDARALVHTQRFSNIAQWNSWCKSGNKPVNIPASPKITYKNKWGGWGDWLGNRVEWLCFDDARRIVHTFNLRSYEDWLLFCTSKQRKPTNIPFEPKKIYRDRWISWADWLGYTSRANGALPGVIYILQHPALPPNVIKVGRSYRLEKRLYEHNRVTQQTMTVLSAFPTENMVLAEQRAHAAVLSVGKRFKYRNHKEYFEVNNVHQAIEAITTAIA